MPPFCTCRMGAAIFSECTSCSKRKECIFSERTSCSKQGLSMHLQQAELAAASKDKSCILGAEQSFVRGLVLLAFERMCYTELAGLCKVQTQGMCLLHWISASV
eukprot:547406-Pelagomonas_calceolata.AAC.4